MRLAVDTPVTIEGMFNLLATELKCLHRIQHCNWWRSTGVGPVKHDQTGPNVPTGARTP